MTINPLVAARLDAPVDPWAGVWIAEDIELISQGVKNGSWIDSTLGVVGAGLDAVAFVSDPVGSLLQYGVAWLIEHVEPLREALDWLAGDPAQISAQAQTWRNVSKVLSDSATELSAAVGRELAEWTGAAGRAYRDWSKQQRAAIAGLSGACGAMATITEAAGFLIAAVRLMVRDAIAVVVSRLIVYAVEEAASLGFATPLVIEQVTTLVAAWAAKIARWLKALLASLRRLMPIIRRLGELIEELKKILTRLRTKIHGGPLARIRGRGAGPKMPMTMESVQKIAEKYGIDISDISLTIKKNIAGICGITSSSGSVKLCREAFRSEEDLARTLVHEKFHVGEVRGGKPYPKTAKELEAWEDRAYAYEDHWWENQPIRPEGGS